MRSRLHLQLLFSLDCICTLTLLPVCLYEVHATSSYVFECKRIGHYSVVAILVRLKQRLPQNSNTDLDVDYYGEW